jgi:hypothetical protein
MTTNRPVATCPICGATRDFIGVEAIDHKQALLRAYGQLEAATDENREQRRRDVLGLESAPLRLVRRTIGDHKRDSGRRTREGTPKMEPCHGNGALPDDMLGYLHAYLRMMCSFSHQRRKNPDGVDAGLAGQYVDPGNRHKSLMLVIELVETGVAADISASF